MQFFLGVLKFLFKSCILRGYKLIDEVIDHTDVVMPKFIVLVL